MSIIPVSADQKLVVIQPDGSELYFRYLTGKRRIEFNRIQEGLKPLAEEFKGQAVNDLIAAGIAEPTEKQIAAKMIELAKRAGKITDENEDANNAALVDMFLCGWKGEGFPELKEGDKPSYYLGPGALVGVVEILSEKMGELLGLTIDDQKN